MILLHKLSSTVRSMASGKDINGVDEYLANIPHERLLKAWEETREFLSRSQALNTDRSQQISVLGINLNQILYGAS